MDDELHLLLSITDERGIQRKRESFLLSVIVHLVGILLVILSPVLFPPADATKRIPLEVDLLENSQQLGHLALPPDYQKLSQRPKPPPPREQTPPVVGPKGLYAPLPDHKDNSADRQAQNNPPKSAAASPEPTAQLPVPNPAEQAVAKDGTQPGEKPPSPAPGKRGPGEGKSDLRDLVARLEVPGASIQSSLEKARKGGGMGAGGGSFGETPRFDKRLPDFTVDEPSILSDTQGVDFSSWLRVIYIRVRDNWYAVIPEVIRSGLKGRVAIIFDLRRNGQIENLQVVRSSGLSPYDRAAISSLKLSEPFPAFPRAFAGDRLTLQFTYLYNIRM